MEGQYYQINQDLTIELAKKAKVEGVKQFIFMSSMIVYGESNAKNREIKINKDTKPQPSNFYDNSKLLDCYRNAIEIFTIPIVLFSSICYTISDVVPYQKIKIF